MFYFVSIPNFLKRSFFVDFYKRPKKIRHFFHLVDSSPWPLLISVLALSLLINLVLTFHFFKNTWFYSVASFLGLLFIMINWFKDIVRESVFEGKHTRYVVRGFRIGMILFILSEVLFFFAFFWAFFHCSLDPAIEIGCIWPPLGIHPINALSYSTLFGTSLLLLSGCTITLSHHYLKAVDDKNYYAFTLFYLLLTIILGISFTVFQFLEYCSTKFNISSGIFGSTFFMITGFHGFHVIIGTIFLIVQFFRLFFLHFGSLRHFGFEASIWYWHFVDVVWIFVYVFIYLWGGIIAKGEINILS